MLCINAYKKDYIDGCRARMEAQLSAYNRLIDGEGRTTGGDGLLLRDFEQLFFNNLVLVLDSYFMHRSRAIEGKDGNPMNEVRMMSNSILQHFAVMKIDKTIKYNPANSILKIEIGQSIKLSESDFVLLSNAYFAEIEAKFM